jgi:predicted nucleotidyltransferase component of viral defense system
MIPAIITMLEKYNCNSRQDYENALKEIIQEVALLGLWRSKFFEVAAFYGGTALRIMYGLNRFSEDLDFSLLTPNASFKLHPYIEAIEAELSGMGFAATVRIKDKTMESNIQSAFIKAETLTHLLLIDVQPSLRINIPQGQTLKIKLEIDINPPGGFLTEAKILLNPIPFSVLTYQAPDLFAGKMHAILCRSWASRVKGRDWYDLVWYISQNIPLRLSHLRERLLQTQSIKPDQILDKETLLTLLEEKIMNLDIEAAKSDILPFIRDPASIALWSPDFFKQLIKKITVIQPTA